MRFNDYGKALLTTTRTNIQVDGAHGFTLDLTTEKGRLKDVVDATSMVGTNPLGHRYEPLLREVRKLYDRGSEFPLMVAGNDFYHPCQRELARKFTKIYPGNLKEGDLKTYYCNTGSEAVEKGCLKASQLYKGSNAYLAFMGAFHGRSALALSANFSKASHTEGYNFLARVLPCPYGYCSRCTFEQQRGKCEFQCVDYVKEMIIREGGKSINAIITEPVQGEGGYIFPPAEFFQGLRELATKHDIPLIMDEVQASMRTGKWFACENYGVQPDMIPVAKPFSGGLTPFGAALIKSEFATKEQGKQSSTFGGNPKECFIALKTIELIEKGNFLENAKKMGDYIRSRLSEIEGLPHVRRVDSLGLMAGIEIQKPNGNPDPKRRDQILERMLHRHRVMTMGCGNPQINPAIRLLPPVNITKEIADRIADAVIESVKGAR